jgi:hypothetical protein
MYSCGCGLLYLLVPCMTCGIVHATHAPLIIHGPCTGVFDMLVYTDKGSDVPTEW